MKRNVFSCFLKKAREVAVVTLVGRLFHARAAVTLKDRSPMVLSRVLGTIRRCWELDCSHRSDSASSVHWRTRRRYGGATLLRQQIMSTASRNCILSRTRNQWRSRRRCVMWSYFCSFMRQPVSRLPPDFLPQRNLWGWQTAQVRTGWMLFLTPKQAVSKHQSQPWKSSTRLLLSWSTN